MAFASFFTGRRSSGDGVTLGWADSSNDEGWDQVASIGFSATSAKAATAATDCFKAFHLAGLFIPEANSKDLRKCGRPRRDCSLRKHSLSGKV